MSSINRNNQAKRFLFISVFLLAVFVLAIVVWYSPTLFKGYAAYTISPNALLARNVYQTGLYSAESDLNVFLSSSLIKEQGHLSTVGNRLTSLLYAKVFKITGLPSENNFVLFSVIIHALTLVIFTLVVLYLFGFGIFLIFPLIYIFLPFNWQLPYSLAEYEFALLFLSLFFLFYLYGLKRKYDSIYLIIAGVFLGLACLSAEALLLIVPFLLIFLWLKKQKRFLFYIFAPFVILFVFLWLSNVSSNVYIQLFTTQVPEKVKSADFSFYGHIYPDPYTYHFEKDEYLKSLQDQVSENRLDLMEKIGRSKVLTNMGIQGMGFIDRIKVGLMISSRHIFRFFSLEDIAGPFVFLLMLLGAYSLRRKNKHLYQFFVYWILSSIFLMAFVVLVVRNHLMDFNWAIALLISLGLLTLGKIVIDYFQFQTKKARIIYLAILLAVLYQLVLVNHVAWSRIYDNSSNLKIKAYSQEIKKMDIADKDIIAVNLGPSGALNLNYLTNKSVVVLRPETIKSLLEKNKLNFTFERFGVKYILGYSEELTDKIVSQTNLVSIASASLKPAVPEMSRNRGWLMNLVK